MLPSTISELLPTRRVAVLTTNGFNLTVNGFLFKTAGTNGNITVSPNSTLYVQHNFTIDANHLNALNNSWVEFTGSSSIDKVYSFANLRINGNVFVSVSGNNTVIRQNIELNSGNRVYEQCLYTIKSIIPKGLNVYGFMRYAINI